VPQADPTPVFEAHDVSAARDCLGVGRAVGADHRIGHHRRVIAEALRDYCLSLKGASETFPFGPKVSVFKVSGKMFALSILDQVPLRISLKCEPELAEQLRATHPAVLPGYHLNKRQWNTVIIDGSLTDQTIKDMIEDSYDLVVSKLPLAQRQAVGSRPDA
jgi:predicted DNA-binding protein (MmcQ/YjbR family)